MHTLDGLKVTFGIFFTILTILCMKNRENYRYFISINFILNLGVIVTTFLSSATNIAQASRGYDTVQLQGINDYIDLGDVAF